MVDRPHDRQRPEKPEELERGGGEGGALDRYAGARE